MITNEQLASRKNGIGGSDIGAILGLNPYRTPVDVYMEKTGQIAPADLSDIEAVHFGNVLEDVVAAEYARRMKCSVRRRNKTFVHKEFPYMFAHVDRSVDGLRKVLECKTASAYMSDKWGDDGTDDVPEMYLVQCCWYTGILDYDSSDLAALIGGNNLRIYHIDRDKELEDMCFRRGAEFWNENVLKMVPPEPVNDRDLATLYAVDSGKIVVADDAITDLVILHKKASMEEKAAKETKDALAFEIKSYIKDASVLLDKQGNQLVTYKKAKDSKRFDEKKFFSSMPNLHSEFCVEKTGSRRFLNKIK